MPIPSLLSEIDALTLEAVISALESAFPDRLPAVSSQSSDAVVAAYWRHAGAREVINHLRAFAPTPIPLNRR